MTVGELIKTLSKYNKDLDVYITKKEGNGRRICYTDRENISRDDYWGVMIKIED